MLCQVGEEASLDPETATFTGRRWQNVRTAINHAARAGITAEWWRFGEAPTELTDQIRTLSQEWVAAKGLRIVADPAQGGHEVEHAGIAGISETLVAAA